MSEDKYTVLCSDSNCIHNEGRGYYGICMLYRKLHGTTPPVAGMVREYRETCKLKEVKSNNDKRQSKI